VAGLFVARRGGAASLVMAVWLGVVASGVAAFAAGQAIDGPAVVPLWAIEAVALLGLWQYFRDVRAAIAAGVMGTLAVWIAIWSPSPMLLQRGTDDVPQALVAWLPIILGALAALALLTRLGRSPLVPAPERSVGVEPVLGRPVGRVLVGVLAGSAAWLSLVLGSTAADEVGRVLGVGLVSACAVLALVRWPRGPVQAAAVALTGLTTVLVLADLIMPEQLATGSPFLGNSLFGAVVVAVLLAMLHWRGRRGLTALLAPTARALAVLALYSASVALVTVLTGHAATTPEQDAQLGLSTFWGAVGLAAVVVGLARHRVPVHRAGAGLLCLSAGKVLLVDTQHLEAIYRVGTLVGVGLAMLLGGFAYLRSTSPD
jgi:Predicted membrane protein (DUF2339)